MIAKVSHTPGPWVAHNLWVQGPPDSNGFRDICTLSPTIRTEKEQAANANLIAQSPALAARLSDLLTLAETMPEFHTAENREVLRGAIEALQAAGWPA